MPLLHIPLPLSKDLIGVNEAMFRFRSAAHGSGHVNRVIFLAMCICKNMGLQELIPSAWAAAHLHDLARMHDGPCERHGSDAVNHLLSHYLPLYFKGGVTPRDIPAIVAAVATHCTNDEFPLKHPHRTLTAILKDADALDRVRFGDVDPSRFRLIRSPLLLPIANTLWQLTGSVCSFSTVWEHGVSIMNPHLGIAKQVKRSWSKAEDGRSRMLRRLRNGHELSSIKLCQDVWSAQINAAEATEFVISKLDEHRSEGDSHRLHRIVECCLPRLTERSMRMQPVTATRDTRRFLESGEYLSFWEAGPSWHNRYHDAPADTRAFNDIRLFGELGERTTYGLLLDPEGSRFEYDLETLNQTYGPKHIWWNRSILDSCSFSLNDSMDQGVVLPYSRDNWVKAACLQALCAGAHIELPAEIMPFRKLTLFFWEFQCHEQLTPNHTIQPEEALSARVA